MYSIKNIKFIKKNRFNIVHGCFYKLNNNYTISNNIKFSNNLTLNKIKPNKKYFHKNIQNRSADDVVTSIIILATSTYISFFAPDWVFISTLTIIIVGVIIYNSDDMKFKKNY